MRGLFRGVACALGVVMLVAGCAPSATPAATAPSPAPPAAAEKAGGTGLPTVNIAISVPSVAYVGLYTALAKGFFQQQGVNVKTTQMESGTTSVQALLGGNVDVISGASQDIVAVSGKGVPLMAFVAMARMTVEFCASKAYVESKGVGPNDPLDKRMAAFKGATIAITGAGANSDRIARWLLSKYGRLDPNIDNTITAINSATGILASVQQGRVQGFIYSPPQCEIAAKEGYGISLVKPSQVPEFAQYIHLVLFSTRDWVNTHKDVAARLATAVGMANNYALAHPDEVVGIIQKDFPKVDPDVVAASLKEIVFPQVVKDGRMSREGWDATSLVLQQLGVLAQPIDTAEGGIWTNEYIGQTAVQ